MSTPQSLFTHNLGFPRIGLQRELKVATEKYWHGKLTQDELLSAASAIRKHNWQLQKEKGINLIPSNDFSLYDQVLDTISLYGAVPPRFGWKGKTVDLDTYFTLARGLQEKEAGKEVNENQNALEMLKWFDTNYHYLVPEFHADTHFTLSSEKVFVEFAEALALGITTKPVLLGPFSFVSLGKAKEDFDQVEVLLPRLVPLFIEVLKRLSLLGATWVQIDEPILTKDFSERDTKLFKAAYEQVFSAVKETPLKLLLATYFDDLGANQSVALSLPFHAVHLDFTRGEVNIDSVLSALAPGNKILSLGLVNGRNIWKIKYDATNTLLKKAVASLGAERVWVGPSCSLIHTPITLQGENKLDETLKSVLSFATEKLSEIIVLAQLPFVAHSDVIEKNSSEWKSFLSSPKLNNTLVRNTLAALKPEDFKRKSVFAQRRAVQQQLLKLPTFPTTTIGSLPQTAEVRNARLKLRKGELTADAYKHFIEDQIREGIKIQEEIGLDVLVTGEFERTDMVEYFGVKLDGFAFTSNAWVQSFGTRYVKPPIIYGDVHRPAPMTVAENVFCQSLTSKPVKGMLTGPITILQWSFVREDQTREETANQIGLAIRDEVNDLVASGSQIVQVDEPAFREGLPLKRERWADYLRWASKAFRLSTSSVADQVQIHTHMCYAEFSDIITAIADLDADVISVESSRSQMKLLPVFANPSYKYPNEIGPGVFDIHSPKIPTVPELVGLLEEAKKVIPGELLWVNPDCGLKTRQWSEVKQQLQFMVEAAKILRNSQK